MAKAKEDAATLTIEGAQLTRLRRGSQNFAAAIIIGKAPKKGTNVRLILGGSVYLGRVFDAVEADGQTLLEFEDGLTFEVETPEPAPAPAPQE